MDLFSHCAGTVALAAAVPPSSELGLCAGIWSRDIGRVHRVAAQPDADRIVVNQYNGGFVQTPCGGFIVKL